jgi:hypothetical protein
LVAWSHLLERLAHRHYDAYRPGLGIDGVVEAHKLGLPLGDVVAKVEAHHWLEPDQFG